MQKKGISNINNNVKDSTQLNNSNENVAYNSLSNNNNTNYNNNNCDSRFDDFEKEIKKHRENIDIFVENIPNKQAEIEEKRASVDYSSFPACDDFSSYNRIDSFISAKNEYTNFYLLNLIIKIDFSFKNLDEFNSLIQIFQYKNLELIYNFDNLKHSPSLFSCQRMLLEYVEGTKQAENKNKQKTEITQFCNLNEKKKVFFDNLLAKKVIKFYSYFKNFHFNLQYIILSLITQKRIKIFYFDFSFFEKIQKDQCEAQDTAAMIIESILKHHNKINSYCLNINEIFSYYFDSTVKIELLRTEELAREEKEKESDNQDNMMIRTILVTPSLIYYKPPSNEKINHILRKYVGYKDNFIKVNFVDEEQGKFYFNSPNVYVILDFLKINMLSGIMVGTRRFNFLSASNSQMKNSSYWYFNLEGTKFQYIEEIIQDLGDFTKEQNIHKNAARRGQFLSTTSHIKELKEDQIEIIADIKSKKGIFTDGIGQISLELAIECAIKFKYDYASAFQIRIGGVKGIVAVNPIITGQKIKIRPSMIKFESDHRELGVIRCSNYSQGFLNRQIIILLYSLGVPKNVFLNMLKKDISRYDYLIREPNKALKDCSGIYSLNFGPNNPKLNIQNSTNGFANDYLKKCYYFAPAVDLYIYNGLNICNDPFLNSLIKTIAIARTLDLKLKGKIMDKYSSVLIGVIDETNTLNEGEVYIHIRQDNCSPFKNIYTPNEVNKNLNTENCENDFLNNNNIILDTEVIVTKNPCLHPGDLKILKAVNLSKPSNINNTIYCTQTRSGEENANYQHKSNPLFHMVNVIVFSSKGERPIQNEIGGGDLDGDSYFVSWNRDLLRAIKLRNISALDDHKAQIEEKEALDELIQTRKKNKEIKMKDIVNSYVEYMKNDTIAMIANYHIALADKDLDKGAFNRNCIRLANLFNIAIDAPKHGNFISQEEVYQGKRPMEFPDFLEIQGFPSYNSPGIIGELYRLIDHNSYITEYKFYEYKLYYLEDYLVSPFFLSDNYYRHLKDAYRIYLQYNSEMNSLMETFKISSEAELFLSEVINQKRKAKANKNKNTDIFTEIANLRTKYASLISKTFGNITVEVACAMYIVTYLNDKSIIECKTSKVNLRCLSEFINILIRDGRIHPNIFHIKSFEQIVKNKISFDKYFDKKNQDGNIIGIRESPHEISLRNFSLPYLVKDVRDKLFRGNFLFT